MPANATSVTLTLYQYVPAGGGTNTLYSSEPCLMPNTGAGASYVPGRSEHGDYLTIGGQKITFGTAPPSTGWWKQEDVRFNSGATVDLDNGWESASPAALVRA